MSWLKSVKQKANANKASKISSKAKTKTFLSVQHKREIQDYKMSHSVFRDLDDNSNCGNYSKGVVADNNIVVFIDKNGDVSVDPNALQDLVGKFCLNQK